MRTFRLALAAAAVFAAVSVLAGTREDIQRLDQQMAALGARLQQVEAQLPLLQKALQDLSARVEALGRASQTADIRSDLEEIKRRLEQVQEQVSVLQSRQELPAAPPLVAPPTIFEAPQGETPSGAAAPPPLAPGAPTTPDLYAQAYADYLQGKYDLSLEEFRRFLQAFPDEGRAGNAQYWIGECLYSKKSFGEAKEAFRTVLDRYPKSPKVLAARLKLGFSHLALDETAQGMTALRLLIQSAPDSGEAAIARERLARIQ
ncbi:MAG: tetratricopeptide repeat protein [Acidobacteriota bacterium]